MDMYPVGELYQEKYHMNATATATSTWTIDPVHSAAEFKIKHMMVSNVKGRFTALTGTVTLDETDISQSSVEATIEAASIDTRNEQRDAHLKSADFFDVEQFPTLAFKSTAVQRVAPGQLLVTGDLTIHGVTRSVSFEVEGPSMPTKDPWGGTRIGLEAVAKIRRKDFGLVYNAALETGGVVVGDEVTISLDVELTAA